MASILLEVLEHRLELRGIQPVLIRRDYALQDIVEKLNSGYLESERKLRVSFAGEDGQDAGGLTRECLSLAWSQAETLGWVAGRFVAY